MLHLILPPIRAVSAFSLLLGAAAAAAPSQYDIYNGTAKEPYYAFPPTWVAPANPNYQRRSEASAVNLKNGDVLYIFLAIAGG